MFDPNLTPGSYEVYYTYDFGAGCTKADTISITVSAPVDPCFGTDTVSINPAGPFAQDAGLQQLTASPLGGTWSGNADANGMFDPNITPGTYEVYYSYDFGAGCTKADTISITVSAPVDPCFGTDTVSINPAGPFAQDAGLQQLTASPLGGTWSGSADANGMFDPNLTPGSYEVYYTYDFGAGCTKADTISISVEAPVNPCFGTDTVRVDSAGPFAQDAGLQQLTASPLGGTWSGNANANGMFDPNLTPGSYEVYYTYDFGAGCTKADTISITVSAPVDPCFGTDTVSINPVGPFAQDAGLQQLTASPLGGTWSGSADANGMFDPNLTPGSYEVYYTYDFGAGCTKADTISISVEAPVDPCFGTDTVSINPAGPFAQDAGLQQLTASPLGGTWSGSADANGMFDPNLTPGSYEVYYTYDFGAGCTKADTISITVSAPVDPCFGTDTVSISPAGSFAQDAGLQQLTASPLGGTWSGNADANGMFDPNLTTGSYEVYYTYDFGAGCTKADTISISVEAPADPCFGTDTVRVDSAGPFAQDSGLQQLTASPLGGTWSGNADANGMFDPNITPGSYEVYYTYDFGAGCTKADTISITVSAPFDPCFGTDTVSINPAGPFAQDAGLQQLTASPLGGTWSGSADANGMFDPNVTPGSYEVYYSYDFGGGCTKSDTIIIVITPGIVECTNPSNLALNQSASQSSTYGDGVASIAVDGNTDGNGSPWGAGALITHTQSGANPWWQVDLGLQADIQQVNIFNRTSCCLDRLKDFYVFVSDQPFSNSASFASLLSDPQVSNTFFPGQAGASENISLTTTGRYVRIQLSASNGPLHIAEVQVMGCPANSNDPCTETPSVSISPAGPFLTDQGIQALSATPSGGTWSGAANAAGSFDPSQGAGSYTVTYTVDFGNGCVKSDDLTILVEDPPTGGECTTPSNLALNQSASQSSTYGDGVASIAVDGNTDGNGSPWGAGASITHTQSDANPWWQVDLGQQADIQQVNIFNRTSCCLDRLSDFYVFVSDQPFSNSATVASLLNDPQVSNAFFSGQAGASENISLTATGRYVRIMLSASNGPLHIAEVQVMGCPANSSDPCSGTPTVSINPAGPFLTDQGIQTLSATPSGGSWSGAANTNGTFDPGQGAGSYTVTYTVDLGNGCVKSENMTIEVNEPGDPCAGTATVSITPAGPFLSNQGIQSLSASPSGGTWSGAANTNGSFDPSQGAGSYTVTYTVDFGNGCIKSDDLTILVEDPPSGGECTTPANLALNQSASQSSTYGDGVASIAVDGNTDGNGSPWGAGATITHTQSGPNTWWQVDLGQQADIQQVNVFNRTSCCSERLSDFYVFVSDQPFSNSATVAELLNDPQVSNTFFSGQAGASENISLTATGRYVRIQLGSTNGPLHIAEVQVMGCPANSSDPCSGTPTVSINPAGPFLTDQGIQQLSASPSGGTWSGAVNSAGSFRSQSRSRFLHRNLYRGLWQRLCEIRKYDHRGQRAGRSLCRDSNCEYYSCRTFPQQSGNTITLSLSFWRHLVRSGKYGWKL